MDFTWIRDKFLQIKKYWKILEKITSTDASSLETDIDLQLKAERLFEVFSQLILDICTHIVSKINEPPPPTYSDCMKTLFKIKVITSEMAEKNEEYCCTSIRKDRLFPFI